MFRAEAGNGMPVYQAWSADYHNSPSDPGCRLLTKTNCIGHYRHWSMDLDKIQAFLENDKKVGQLYPEPQADTRAHKDYDVIFMGLLYLLVVLFRYSRLSI